MVMQRWVIIGVIVVGVALAGWRVAGQWSERTSKETVQAVESMVDTMVASSFTVAQGRLAERLGQTGTFAGTTLEPPLRLVHADQFSYCIEYDRPPVVQHLEGPNGSVTAGPC